jgi:hypothetical protein
MGLLTMDLRPKMGLLVADLLKKVQDLLIRHLNLQEGLQEAER